MMYSRYGVRNSLLLAPMPTASTAQILGNNESIEAYTNNIYTRRVLSGEFQVSDNIFTQNCILEFRDFPRPELSKNLSK